MELALQPARWSLRLGGDALDSISALCVVRDAEGRWLAGRRAAWVATWAERWALGAGGSVEVGEHPAETLARELEEEWSVVPEALTAEGLVRIPSGLVLFVGMATLAPGARGGDGPRARRPCVVAARPRRLARGGRHPASRDGADAGVASAARAGPARAPTPSTATGPPPREVTRRRCMPGRSRRERNTTRRGSVVAAQRDHALSARRCAPACARRPGSGGRSARRACRGSAGSSWRPRAARGAACRRRRGGRATGPRVRGSAAGGSGRPAARRCGRRRTG